MEVKGTQTIDRLEPTFRDLQNHIRNVGTLGSPVGDVMKSRKILLVSSKEVVTDWRKQLGMAITKVYTARCITAEVEAEIDARRRHKGIRRPMESGRFCVEGIGIASQFDDGVQRSLKSLNSESNRPEGNAAFRIEIEEM